VSESYDMAWSEVFDRLGSLPKYARVYGVPRGGAIVAGLLASRWANVVVARTPEDADCILDDIIDSGATKARYPGKPFHALVDKTGSDAAIGWVRFPWEHKAQHDDLADTVVRQLQAIGEDPTREGLRETPQRYLKAMREMTEGLRLDPREPLRKMFNETHDEIVVVRGIPFTSLCEHHLLPFSGTVDFAYLPAGAVVGLSKIPRFIHILAKRPQVQERLTAQIADIFCEVVAPRGAMVVVKGEHSCMRLRGVRSDGDMVTSVVRGVFKDKPEARAEALALFTRR